MKFLFCVLVVASILLIYSNANPLKLIRPFIGHRWRNSVKPPSVDANTPKSPTYYHDSKIDNFDLSNTKTYKQRYWYNSQWYKPNGPQFLMIGGETAMSSGWVDSGNSQFGMLAKEVGAMVFTLEHRFYGESQPTGDLTFKSLKYLTSEQALADIHAFILSMNDQFKFNSTRWITFGGSYPGALSAWARQLYPELIYAAIASSAPVQAVVDNSGYLDVVYNALNNYNSACAESVHSGFLKINELIKTSEGLATLSSTFNSCYQLKNDANNIRYFYEAIIGPYMSEIQNSNAAIISNLCSIQTSAGDDLQGIVEVHKMVVGDGCLYIDYENYLNYLRKTDFDNVEWAGYRAWTWQLCNEFGNFQTTDSPLTSLSFTGNVLPVDYYVQICAQIFDPSLSNSTVYQNVQNTNNLYHGQIGFNGTKVVFPNGSNDPWHVLGVLAPTNDKTYPVIIDGASHCADMVPNPSTDTPAILEGRQKIRSHVLSWIYE